ncbi:MAG: fatty acid desaturase [Polymorphobacter sp.]|uniref:fatty acid desaturase n=1 Tax=Polymorphobacter sp. TaxID=1909290 RepID=UPI003A83DF6A
MLNPTFDAAAAPPRPASRADVRVNFAAAAAIMLSWVAIHLGAIFTIDLAEATPLMVAGLVLMQTWLSTGLFIIAHDCMHGSFAGPGNGWNRRVGRLALMIYAGLDYDAMRPAHVAHHRHVGTADDPDFSVASPRRPLRWLVDFFMGYYSHMQLVRITVMALLWMALGASLFNIVLFWAVPALLALLQLFFFGTFLPHRHEARGFADAHRARSVGPGGLWSVISCFHFGGYHLEHHRFPQLPWWRLPEADTAVQPADRRGRAEHRL